jgi:hypothetical protein
MLNFNDLSKGKRYTLPHIKGHGYHLQLASIDEQVRNNGANNYYKSATFRASGGSKRMMDVVGSHVFNVTFWEDGESYVADTLLTEE